MFKIVHPIKSQDFFFLLNHRLPDLLRHQLRHDAALLPLEDQVLAEERDEAAHEVPLQRLLDGAVEDEVGGRVHELGPNSIEIGSNGYFINGFWFIGNLMPKLKWIFKPIFSQLN